MLPWWAWFLIAGACCLVQMFVPTEKDEIGLWAVRIGIIAAMVFTAIIGVVRGLGEGWAWAP